METVFLRLIKKVESIDRWRSGVGERVCCPLRKYHHDPKLNI